MERPWICFFAVSFLSWSVGMLSHFCNEYLLSVSLATEMEEEKMSRPGTAPTWCWGPASTLEDSLCMFSCSVSKHLIWKYRKEFFIRSTRFDGWQDFNANPPKCKRKQNKGKVLHLLPRSVLRLVPGGVCGMSANPAMCLGGRPGAAGGLQKREKLCLSYRVICRLVWALDQPNVTFSEAASSISGCPNIIIKWCLLNI